MRVIVTSRERKREIEKERKVLTPLSPNYLLPLHHVGGEGEVVTQYFNQVAVF